jgi:uncharacterized membrane protein YidH (DUF202 family)
LNYTPDDSTEDNANSDSKDLRMTLSVIRTLEAEKRTHLAELRTGIGILTIPFSLTTILIATSNYYEIESVLYLITGLVIGILVLVVVGGYLVIRSLQRIRETDRMRAGISFDVNDYVINSED